MNPEAFLPLWAWFAEQMREMRRLPGQQGPGMLMGCPIWGGTFIDRFGKYCLPTICAPKNLAALSGNCRIVLFTDPEGWLTLDTMMKPLRLQWGIDYQIVTLPPDMMKLATDGQHHYQVLAACQNLLLQMAAWWGMSFHMLMPDHVHGEAFFANLDRLAADHDAIVQTGISADIRTAMRDIEAYRPANDEPLTIPDRELGDIGRRHLHPQMRVYLMNDARLPDRMPNSHYMLWQAPDRMRIHSPHMNATYLSARLCALAPVPIGANLLKTIDTRLPVLIPNGKFHVVQIDDGMTYIEVSDGSKGAYPGYVGGETFALACWKNVHFSKRFMPYFNAACDVPTKYPEDGKEMTLDAIADQHAASIDYLMANRARLAIEQHEKQGALWQEPKAETKPIPQLEAAE